LKAGLNCDEKKLAFSKKRFKKLSAHKKYRNLALTIEQTTEDLSETQDVEYHDVIKTSSQRSDKTAISHRRKEVVISLRSEKVETIQGSGNPDKKLIVQLLNEKGKLHSQIAWFDKKALMDSDTIFSLKQKIKRDEDVFLREEQELNSKIVSFEENIVSLQSKIKENEKITSAIKRDEDVFLREKQELNSKIASFEEKMGKDSETIVSLQNKIRENEKITSAIKRDEDTFLGEKQELNSKIAGFEEKMGKDSESIVLLQNKIRENEKKNSATISNLEIKLSILQRQADENSGDQEKNKLIQRIELLKKLNTQSAERFFKLNAAVALFAKKVKYDGNKIKKLHAEVNCLKKDKIDLVVYIKKNHDRNKMTTLCNQVNCLKKDKKDLEVEIKKIKGDTLMEDKSGRNQEIEKSIKNHEALGSKSVEEDKRIKEKANIFRDKKIEQ